MVIVCTTLPILTFLISIKECYFGPHVYLALCRWRKLCVAMQTFYPFDLHSWHFLMNLQDWFITLGIMTSNLEILDLNLSTSAIFFLILLEAGENAFKDKMKTNCNIIAMLINKKTRLNLWYLTLHFIQLLTFSAFIGQCVHVALQISSKMWTLHSHLWYLSFYLCTTGVGVYISRCSSLTCADQVQLGQSCGSALGG